MGADGLSWHLATYQMQNAGRRRLEITLPPTVSRADVTGAWIDDVAAAWRRTGSDDDGTVTVPLPGGVKFPVVSIEFTASEPKLVLARRIAPLMPEVDVPVLARRWTFWLPPGREWIGGNGASRPGQTADATWSQRLFGPLGAGGPRTPRSIRSRADDWAVASPFPQRDSIETASQLRQAIGRHALRHDADANHELAWAVLLSEETLGGLGPRVIVDGRALTEAGLLPQTPVSKGHDSDPAGRGLELLQRAELAILIDREIALVTTARQAALWRAQLEPMENPVFWTVSPGPLANRLAQAADGGADDALASIGAWRAFAGGRPCPWKLALQSDHRPSDTRGWSAYSMEVSTASPPCAMVADRAALETVRWIAMLLTIALGWRKSAERPMLTMIAAVVAAIAALLLAPLVAVVASGMLLGSLVCLGSRLTRRAARSGRSRDDSTTTHATPLASGSSRAVVVSSLLVLAAMVSGGAASGGESTADRPPYQVFVPVDRDRKPVGGNVYVPEGLYHALDGLVTGAETLSKGWLIEEATYRGVLSWQAAPRQLAVDEFTAAYRVRTFGPGATRARLPLRRDALELPARGVLLDGRTIYPRWDEQGVTLEFDVPVPGEHRLELALRPTTRTDKSVPKVAPTGNAVTGQGFDLAIPRIARSRLELTLPANAPTIDIPLAKGAIVVEGQRLIAQLGAADRLSVRWSGETSRAAEPSAEVEELLWLKIAPGSIVLDARLKFRVLQGHLGEFLLRADPRLRLLEISPGVQIEEMPDHPRLRRVKLATPCEEQTTIAARFLLQDSSGVGNPRLPQLHVDNVRLARRWFAVSVDESLKHETKDAKPPSAVALPDFLSAWGKTDSRPLFARELGADEPAWSISTQPWPSQTTVDQSLAVSFGEREADFQIDAQLTSTSGYGFNYRVETPAALVVDRVAVIEDGVDRVSRWSREADGAVNIALTGPAAGPRTLQLSARWPTPREGDVELPIPRIDGGQLKSFNIALFRKPAVLVAVRRTEGLAEAEMLAVAPAERKRHRFVKAFSRNGNGPVVAVVALRPNNPKVEVKQTTTVRAEKQSYVVEVGFQVNVGEGVLDEMVLQVPPEFAGPYRVEPAMTVAQPEIPGAGPQLSLRPDVPFTEPFRFTLSSPLSGKPTRVADISLRRADTKEHRVILPSRSDKKPLRWDIRNLTPAAPREDASTPLPTSNMSAEYKVVGNSFEATLAPDDQPEGVPVVRRANVRLAWRADGTCFGECVFDLEPAGRGWCPLILPEGCRLARLSVGGVPTVPIPVGNSREGDLRAGERYRVELGPQSVPRRIEVVFTGVLPEVGSDVERTFDAPRLGELPVERTLWTVVAPPTHEPDEPSETEAAGELGESVSVETPSDNETAELWAWTLGREGQTVRREVKGAMEPITVHYRLAETSWREARLPIVLGLCVLLVVLSLKPIRSVLGNLVVKRPYLAGVLLGVAWWLFLSPSALGWIIALASLFTAFRGSRRRQPASHSAVVPLG